MRTKFKTFIMNVFNIFPQIVHWQKTVASQKFKSPTIMNMTAVKSSIAAKTDRQWKLYSANDSAYLNHIRSDSTYYELSKFLL